MITIYNLSPLIKQMFNRYLLDPLLGMIMDVREKIVPLANKKIRPQDVGRRREFDKLLKQCEEVYERKKAEEAAIIEKNKKLAQERSHLSNSGKTMCFKRFQTT